MITTFAKLRAPMAGLGRATLQFSKSFNKLSPDQFKASPLARTCGRASH